MMDSQSTLVDGFATPRDGLRWWAPSTFEMAGSSPRLFKLHGSINWWYADVGAGPPWPPLFKVDPIAAGRPRLPRDAIPAAGPVLLVGRFNKMMKQSYGLFLELISWFQRALRETGYLVIVGYGFGDKGVNSLLVEWLADPANRVVVVDRSREGVLKLGRSAIQATFPGFEAEGRVEFATGGLAVTSWTDVKAKLRV